jgi:hypothetical protein
VALSDVTAEGVEHAMAEFDRLGREAFLSKFGFGKARGYFLIRGARRYDSKAVVGVAHGHDRPNLGPLRSQDFSGGEARVAPLLESLGFEVERPPRNLSLTEKELILALDLYLRLGLLDDSDPAVNDLSVQSERPDADRFHNPNGVALKLANFAAIDPNYDGRGMTRGGTSETEVWDRYASDEDALAATATAIREGRDPPLLTRRFDEPIRPQVIEVEAQHVELFRVSVPSQDIEATRREQCLVRNYADHLRELGHSVTRHRYPMHGSGQALACDLVDETDHVLYEAKGDVRRASVRMAVGQLLDYRRFEPPSMGLAILLPHQPAQDLIRLIHSVPASVVWRTKDGFCERSAVGLQHRESRR